MKKPVIYSNPDRNHLHKFFPKYIRNASLFINNGFDGKRAFRNIQKLKKAKCCFNVNLTNQLATSFHHLFLSLIKSQSRSIQQIFPHYVETKFAKKIKSLKAYELNINDLADWKNLAYIPSLKILKMLDSGVLNCLDFEIPDEAAQIIRKFKIEALFRRYLISNNQLEMLVFRGNLSQETFNCFKMMECHSSSLKHLHDISLLIFSFGTKELLDPDNLPNFFSRVTNLRLIKSGGNKLAENIIKKPNRLQNVSKIAIDIANSSDKNFEFLSNIRDLQSLQSLQIIVYSSGKSMFDSFLSSLAIPSNLSELIFHIHNLRMSDLIPHSPSESHEIIGNPFKYLEGYNNFLKNLENSPALKTLEMKLFSNDFKEYYTEFFSDIFQTFHKLENARLRIIEPSYNISQSNFPEAFRFDNFINKQTNSIKTLKTLIIAAPKVFMKKFSEDLGVFENLQEFQCIHKLETPEDLSNPISEFLGKIQPKQTFRIGIGKETIKGASELKERFESFLSIPNIGNLDYAFKGDMTEEEALEVINEYVDKFISVCLKFSLVSDSKSWKQRNIMCLKTRENKKTLNMYDRGFERYIFWGPKGSRKLTV